MESNNNVKSELNQADLEKKIKVEYHPHGLYYVIPSQIMDSKILSATEKLCYALISGLAHENGTCFPSDKYLADRLGVSKETVHRCIKKFTELELISKYTDRSNMMRPKRIIKILTRFPSKFDDNDIVTDDDNDIVAHDEIVSKDILVSKDKEKGCGHCCKYLFNKLKKLRPKRAEPNWKIWELDMKRTMEIDKRSKEDILKMIDWVFETDNGFVVDCPASLRKKYENIADHMQISKNKKVEVEKVKNDPRLIKAFKILDDYLAVINDLTIATNLSLKLEEKIIYHTTHKTPYKKTYEKFMEILKNQNAPFHLIKTIEEKVKDIK